MLEFLRSDKVNKHIARHDEGHKQDPITIIMINDANENYCCHT